MMVRNLRTAVGRCRLPAALVAALLASAAPAMAERTDVSASTQRKAAMQRSDGQDAAAILDWGKTIMESVLPEPFDGLVGGVFDLMGELVIPEKGPSEMELQIKNIEKMLKESLQLSVSIQSSLDNLAQNMAQTEFNNTVENRLRVINDINARYGSMYEPTIGVQKPFPRPEADFYSYGAKVGANPGSYKPLIENLGGFVPAGPPRSAIRTISLKGLSEQLSANLAPQGMPIQEWTGLQTKYVQLLTTGDAFSQVDPALATATANRRIASLQMAYVNALSKLYHLWSLKLAIYFNNKSLFQENNHDKLEAPFLVDSRWSGESGYNKARQQAYIYFMGVMHNQLVAVFGGRKALTTPGGSLILNGTRLVFDDKSGQGAVRPYKTKETVDLINSRISDGGAPLFDPSFPAHCRVISVSMRKVGDNTGNGGITGYCRTAEGRLRSGLSVPYKAETQGLKYETIGIKRITVTGDRLTAGGIDTDMMIKHQFGQSGDGNDGHHWPIVSAGIDTNWDIVCGPPWDGERYDLNFSFRQGSIHTRDTIRLLAKQDSGRRGSDLDYESGSFSVSRAGDRRFDLPGGQYDSRSIRYQDFDIGYWSCTNNQYPVTSTIGSHPTSVVQTHNAAYIYGRAGEAHFAVTPYNRLFTVSYVNQENIALRDRGEGERYKNVAKPNYSRPNGGWISTVSLQCLKGDPLCVSEVIGGVPMVYWANGDNLEMVQMRPRNDRDFEVAYYQVPGNHPRPPVCKGWTHPNDGAKAGEIYRYVNTYQNNRVDYFRLKKAPYWYFPTDGSSNVDWEFLGNDPVCIER